MDSEPLRESTIAKPLVAIAHSAYTKSEFIVEGIGPASFRAHYITLANGITLNLFTAEITVVMLPESIMPGETDGMLSHEIIGRRVIELVRDDMHGSLIILEGNVFLKDDNDGFYGNPLVAGLLSEHYTCAKLSLFTDYWSRQPASCAASN